MLLEVQTAPGEFLDKLTILEIKSERIADPAKLANVRRELDVLRTTWSASPLAARDVSARVAELKRVNEALWEIEDGIRRLEAERRFDVEFVELARSVCRRDDHVDQLDDQMFRELLTYMMQDPKTITRAVNLILVSRHLERIADHATNIAEDVVYLVQGRTIKHHVAGE